MTVTFETVTTARRFGELGSAWDTLWRQGEANAFQSHGWIEAWLRSTARGGEHGLLIGLAWDGDRLASVFPCALHRHFGVRLLEWAAQPLSDYCDAFGDKAHFEALWAKLRRDGRPDVVRLKNVAPGAAALAVLQRSGLAQAEDDECLMIRSQWPDGAAWFRTLNKKKRNNHARARRKLEERGRVKVEVLARAPPGALDKLVALKQAWLRHHNLRSPLVENGAGLVADLVNALQGAGQGCLALLTCDGDVVAGSVNVAAGRRLLAFFSAYDPQFEAASPGITLMTEYTRWAFDHGFAEVDYLRGAEPYKHEFANASVRLRSFAGGCSLKGKLALSAFGLGQRLKGFRQGATERKRTGGAYATQAGNSRLG